MSRNTCLSTVVQVGGFVLNLDLARIRSRVREITDSDPEGPRLVADRLEDFRWIPAEPVPDGAVTDRGNEEGTSWLRSRDVPERDRSRAGAQAR